MNNYLSTSNDIRNSRPFDVHVWSDYPEFNQLVNKLWVKYLPLEDSAIRPGPKSKATSKVHFKTLRNCPACTEALVHTFGYLTETHFCNQLT